MGDADVDNDRGLEPEGRAIDGSTPTPRTSPYKGLTPYTADDADYFFGRESEREIIAANLLAARLTVLYGPSGVGKTSLLHAGLSRDLRAEAERNRAARGVSEFLPVIFSAWREDDVTAGVLAAIRDAAGESTAAALDVGGSLTDGLVAAGAAVGGEILLILDQFEEYFLYHPHDEGDRGFDVQLARAVSRTAVPANFLISIREDALAGLDRFKGRIPHLFDNYLRVRHLHREAARAAIEQPVRRFNADYAGADVAIDPALVEQVLDEVKAGRPLLEGEGRGGIDGKDGEASGDDEIETPYLQLVMTRLWDEEVKEGSPVLRRVTLARLGGAIQIMRSHLDTSLAELTDAQRNIAARSFRFLVTPSGTKIALAASDLADYARVDRRELIAVLEHLSQSPVRILRPVADHTGRDEPQYEIFHDVLAAPILDWRRRYVATAQQMSPVSGETGDRDGGMLGEGIALSLSGGGYRAMMFHTGVLWRLNELGYLSRLDRVSSVSGGSITAAALAIAWARLDLERHAVSPQFEALVVRPLRKLAGQTIDTRSILGGVLRPRHTIGDAVAEAFRKFLVGDATLQGLPDHPRFVINATNMQTGSLWRFSKPYMADHRIGMYPDPRIDLAVAVAASAAFPPLLSPVRLTLDPNGFSEDGRGPQHMPPYTTDVMLSDGGVYDNLGLETTWKRYRTILVSDGGGQMAPTPKPGSNWLQQATRVQSVTDNQVRSLRKRQTVAGFACGDRDGTYWGIRSDIANFLPPSGGVLPCPHERTMALARTPTRLGKMTDELQERLINWGYAVCDAAMRTYVVGQDHLGGPPRFPYPQRGVG